MFGSKKKRQQQATQQLSETTFVDDATESVDAYEQKNPFLKRLTKGLKRTRSQFASGLGSLFLGRKVIDDELFEEIETQLLMADVGIHATQKIIDSLAKDVKRNALKDPQVLYDTLKQQLRDLLVVHEKPLIINKTAQPFVILVVGVNGVGKTTTIGKLANFFKAQNHSVLLAAGDTFRAAACEQLQIWGDRNKVPVVAQHTGADSASVIFDAVSAAKTRNIDVVIADTAGRLHNKEHLMTELEKIKRVLKKISVDAPHATLLVLDASTGQNALSQAEQFHQAVGVSGIVLTKLDGTAKGGIIFALSTQMDIPIQFIGIGEQLDDLRPFEAKPFVEALFDQSIKNQPNTE